MRMSTEQYSDPEIIRRILEGDIALFEILIRRYNAILYRTGRSYNYCHEDTRDLMQDTWLDAYANLSKFENRSAFKTWLTRIMLNNCFRKKRKLSFSHEIAMEPGEKSVPVYADNNHSDTAKSVAMRELAVVIENALGRLNQEFRMVFMLREINGFSVEETAEALNISQANVKTRLHRAKSLLRKEIERSYQPEDIFEFNLIYCDEMVNVVMQKLKSFKPV